MTTTPTRARVIEWNAADAVGTLETASGETLRFGASACVGFQPGVGIECWIVETQPDAIRPGSSRATVINLTGAIESSRRHVAERFLRGQEAASVGLSALRESRRDAFWEGLPRTDSGEIAWPRNEADRAALVDTVVGAAWIGACDHVLQNAIDVVNGSAPRAGDSDFDRLRPRAEVFRTLDDEQRRAVIDTMIDLAHATTYWGMVKIDRLPSATSALRVEPHDENGTGLGSLEIEALHERFHEWVDRFADAMRKP